MRPIAFRRLRTTRNSDYLCPIVLEQVDGFLKKNQPSLFHKSFRAKIEEENAFPGWVLVEGRWRPGASQALRRLWWAKTQVHWQLRGTKPSQPHFHKKTNMKEPKHGVKPLCFKIKCWVSEKAKVFFSELRQTFTSQPARSSPNGFLNCILVKDQLQRYWCSGLFVCLFASSEWT